MKHYLLPGDLCPRCRVQSVEVLTWDEEFVSPLCAACADDEMEREYDRGRDARQAVLYASSYERIT